MKRYKTEQLRVSGPIRGFLIHTPSGKTMRDIYPNTIVKELNRMAKRIKRLEEALEGTIKCFVDLADSGDAGFWNPDEQSVIIAARAALEAKEAKL